MSSRPVWLIVVCVACGVLWSLAPSRPVVPPPQAPPPTMTDLSPTHVHRALFVLTMRHVPQLLFAPATARFPRAAFAVVAHPGDRYRFRIVGQVDSQNVHGTMIRKPYALTVYYRCTTLPPSTSECWDIERMQVGALVYQPTH